MTMCHISDSDRYIHTADVCIKHYNLSNGELNSELVTLTTQHIRSNQYYNTVLQKHYKLDYSIDDLIMFFSKTLFSVFIENFP